MLGMTELVKPPELATRGALGPLVARELLTVAAWFAASPPMFGYLIRHGRRTGTLGHA